MDERTALLELMHFYNPWWEKGNVSGALALPYERPCLTTLLSHLKLNRVLVVKGPRRTGKSTLLYQMIKSLINSGVPPQSILYLSFDEILARSSLDEIINNYEAIVKKPLVEMNNVYFFLDEVQFLPNWSVSVKRHFDMRSPVKFTVSGSSASLLKKGAESLAGRTVEETILPFTFREYVAHKEPDGKLTAIVTPSANGLSAPLDATRYLPYQSKIRILFDEYLNRGGFPHLFGVSEEVIFRKLLSEDVIGKVIYRDLVTQFGVKKPYVLEKLFLYLANASPCLLNASNVSHSLALSREYVDTYIDYLKSAYLISGIRKFSRSVESSVRAAEKVFVIDPALCLLAGRNDPGYLAETVVARHLFGKNVFYWRNKYEVDFVLETADIPMPIEVKYKNEITADDLKGITSFMDRFSVRKGIVLTKDFAGEMKAKGRRIICKPLRLALLQIE